MPHGQGIVRRSIEGVARKMVGFPMETDDITMREVPLHTQDLAQRIY